MLSLYKLEIFASVVQSGSFSAAASRLYMTQPAVSQHIQDLENHLGTRLFDRGRRGVRLTDAGTQLYDYTLRILRLVAEAEAAVTDVEHLSGGQVNIGATPGVSVYLLPDWLRGFRARYPNLAVTLQTDVTSQIASGVLAHRLDIGFVEGELEEINQNGLGHITLAPISLFVITPADHPLQSETALTLVALDGQAFITRQPRSRTRIWLDRVLSAQNINPRIVAEFDNPEAIKQAVMSGLGISVLPEYAVRREADQGLLRALPLSDSPLQRQLKLIYDEQNPQSPVARALLLHLADAFPQVTALL